MPKNEKKPPGKKRERDKKGRFIKQEPGQSALPGKPFGTTDERARLAGQASGAARREKGDLRRLMLTWLEEDVANGKDGEKISGGQAWVRWVLKEAAKGNMKALEMIRDTAGYKPVDKVMVADVEPSVIAEVEQMVQEAENEE